MKKLFIILLPLILVLQSCATMGNINPDGSITIYNTDSLKDSFEKTRPFTDGGESKKFLHSRLSNWMYC